MTLTLVRFAMTVMDNRTSDLDEAAVSAGSF
jgi:hypothetical protein